MRTRVIGLPSLVLALATGLVFCSGGFAQAAPQAGAANGKTAGPAPKRDLSGVWAYAPQGAPGPLIGDVKGRSYVPEDEGKESPGGEIPPMTPWAKVKFNAEKPGYGLRAAPGGNDPILQCDPIGFPRILFFITPYEFAQIPGRVLQFFERDHAWREMWTDGRDFPKDTDPTWFGTSIAKWVDDNTLVVETEGLDDRTWLGATGYPHSDSMHVEERYHRTDQNTIEFSMTMTDPVAYTKPWVAAPKILKLQPKRVEIPQYFCVWSEENSFTQHIRVPAAVSGGDTRPRDGNGRLRAPDPAGSH